jgi:MFS family permease
MPRRKTRGSGLPARRTPAGAWLIVFVFLLFYLLSFVDRSIINMMVAPLERDLHLTDFQISLLMGPAFALFYVICGLPMGWLMDRLSRRWLVIGGVTTWGLASGLCGFAANFTQLFGFRLGVGVGEATLTPAAHSVIAEEVPREHLSVALSVYAMGAMFGGGLATFGGGALVHLVDGAADYRLPVMGLVHPWQIVFLVVGCITILAAPLGLFIRSTLTRGSNAHLARAAADAKASVVKCATLGELLRSYRAVYIAGSLGFAFSTTIVLAYAAWIPTFMMRTYGWNAAQAGAGWGAQHIAVGIVGYLLGGYIVDRMFANGVKDAHIRFHLFGLLVSLPLAIVAFLVSSPWAFLLLSGVFYMLVGPFAGYAAASVQIYTPPHLRGQVSAVFLTIVTGLSSFVGAPATAWLTTYVFRDPSKLNLSLICVTVGCAPFALVLLLIAARGMRRLGVEQDAFARSMAQAA